jgi:hypothetical protein
MGENALIGAKWVICPCRALFISGDKIRNSLIFPTIRFGMLIALKEGN